MSTSAPTRATASSTSGPTASVRRVGSRACRSTSASASTWGRVCPSTSAVRAASLSRVPAHSGQRRDVVNRATVSFLRSLAPFSSAAM